MPVKLTEVAREAGVSLATASRVLNGSARTPAEDIAKRVRAAAEELGYVANAQAQALAKSTTGLVGLVVHDIADPYFSTFAHGVQKVASLSHRQVLLAGTDLPGEDDHPGDAELAAVRAFISYRTDAIILAASRLTDEDPRLAAALERYINNGGRVVVLGATKIAGASSLMVANKAGAMALATALIKHGTTQFAILAGPAERNTARTRVDGFMQGLQAASLTPLATVHGSFTSRGGYDATVDLIQRLGLLAPTPDTMTGADSTGFPSPSGSPLCILVANDVMALGAMTALRTHGFRIPNDVQVAGFDDIPTLRDHSPALTTYRLPLEQMGQRAAELALEPQLRSPITITGEVVLRESAGFTAPTTEK